MCRKILPASDFEHDVLQKYRPTKPSVTTAAVLALYLMVMENNGETASLLPRRDDECVQRTKQDHEQRQQRETTRCGGLRGQARASSERETWDAETKSASLRPSLPKAGAFVITRVLSIVSALFVSVAMVGAIAHVSQGRDREEGAGGSSVGGTEMVHRSENEQQLQQERQSVVPSSRVRKETHDSDNSASATGKQPTTAAAGVASGYDGTRVHVQKEETEGEQPNVIFILIDDVGMNDIGHQSTDLGELTPFMDSLSSEGVRLSKYYTNHLCTPSRVSRAVFIATFICDDNDVPRLRLRS